MKNYQFWLPLITVIILRFYLYYSAPKIYDDGDKLRITTRVRTEPIAYEYYQYLKLEGLKIYLPLFPEISYGDEVVVEGIVEVRNKKLDVGFWSRKSRSDHILKNPELVFLQPSQGFLYKFRQGLLSFYRKNLPEPHSSLIAGVTIGSKSGIPSDFWEKLKLSGTAHVVVASGMNVTLVAGFLLNFFVILMKRKKALIFTLIGVWFYALLSGFDAPIVRAAIMGSIAFSAQELGRLNAALRALMFSGVIMLLINPSYIEDVGFLLSFFATLGLILFENRIERFLSNKIKILDSSGTIVSTIRTDFATTLAAQIAVFPLLFYYFGRFNILSPLVNTAVLWTIVPITILGMIGGVVGIIVPILGKGILLMAYPLTLWFVTLVNLFA